jgi:D-lactate dehydrogenase
MKNILLYSSKPYDNQTFNAQNTLDYRLEFLEAHLDPKTATLAKGYDAVCAFVNDDLGAETLTALKDVGINTVALRCAGYNNVDLATANDLGMTVVRVPAYSPYAVAEHALALIMTLNRKTHKAYNRTREGNFLIQGLVGKDIHGKTVGVIGTGKIGQIFADIMLGMGCTVIAYDPYPNADLLAKGVVYHELHDLLSQSDMISLHCPLMPQTHHIIDAEAVKAMKCGTMLINTSRGGLIDTQAVIDGLKDGTVGALGLDVYEEEGDIFFENLSETVIQDDVFSRLLTFPNVLITGHQAFLTEEALHNIAETTLSNLKQVWANQPCPNMVNA